MLVLFLRSRFHALVNPLPAHGRVDVIDFHSDRAGVNGASFAGIFPFPLQLRGETGTQKAQGVEVAFEISELAVGGENTLTIGVGKGRFRLQRSSLRWNSWVSGS